MVVESGATFDYQGAHAGLAATPHVWSPRSAMLACRPHLYTIIEAMC
jgi:hypothetical protein